MSNFIPSLKKIEFAWFKFQIFAKQDSHPWLDEISNSRHCTSMLFLLDNLQPLMEELFSLKLLH